MSTLWNKTRDVLIRFHNINFIVVVLLSWLILPMCVVKFFVIVKSKHDFNDSRNLTSCLPMNENLTLFVNAIIHFVVKTKLVNSFHEWNFNYHVHKCKFSKLYTWICSQNKISCFQEDNNMLKNVITRSHFSLSKTFLGFVHSPIGHAKHFGKDRSW